LAIHSGREADHSPPSSAEVEERVELYLHSPNALSWRDAQLGGAPGLYLVLPFIQTRLEYYIGLHIFSKYVLLHFIIIIVTDIHLLDKFIVAEPFTLLFFVIFHKIFATSV
jgi:hypothetical protein